MTVSFKFQRLALAVLLATGAAAGLTACGVAVVEGAAAAGGLVATDRRSPQTQLADEVIEQRAGGRVADLLKDTAHVNAISYYRKVLLTGEVPTAQDRERVQAAVAQVAEVVGVVNELGVMPNSSLGQRSNDTWITGQVKTSMLNANGVPANSIKVVTERGVVYLMGRLTRRETDLATEIARTTPGVLRVVRVVDFISEQAALHPNDPHGTNAAPAPVSGTGTAPASPAATAPGVVATPVTQPTVVQQPPIQVQTLPPVK